MKTCQIYEAMALYTVFMKNKNKIKLSQTYRKILSLIVKLSITIANENVSNL